MRSMAAGRQSLVSRALAAVLAMVGSSSCSMGPVPAGPGTVSEAEEAQQRGRFSRAEQLWLAALRQAAAENDISAETRCYYQLAKLYSQWGLYKQAARQYSQFLYLKQGRQQEYHGVGWNLSELGDLYFKDGDWDAAIPRYIQALDNWSKFARVPETIGTLDRLATCFWRRGDLSEAELYYWRAFHNYELALAMPGLQERKYLVDVNAALAHENCATMLAYSGKSGESERRRSQADQIWTELAQRFKCPTTLPVSAAAKANLIETIAKYYCRAGKHVEANMLYDLLFDLENKTASAGHPTGASARAALAAEIYWRRENCLEASDEARAGSRTGGQAGAAAHRRISNPYLAEFYATRTAQDCFDRRQQLCQRYAWAIPNDKALSTLAANQPLVEVGAGTGYWAHLLEQRGVKIVAYDIQPVPSQGNTYHQTAGKSWADVRQGDETVVREYPASTLFLSWPPDTNQCAFNALRLFRGDRLIYVGEGPGGCTASREFHDLVARQWKLVEKVEIPQWTGTYDALFVYARKNATSAPPPYPSYALLKEQAAALLGARLGGVAGRSSTLLYDLSDLAHAGIKLRFVGGSPRAYYDEKAKTIYIARSMTDAGKSLAVAHEYAHALLYPMAAPVPGKLSKEAFVDRGIEQEVDAVVHELMVADELARHRVPLGTWAAHLLWSYKQNGRAAVARLVCSSANSATGESYAAHYSQWYDEATASSHRQP